MNDLKKACLSSVTKVPAWGKLKYSEKLALMVAFKNGAEEVLHGFKRILEEGNDDRLPEFIDYLLGQANEWREELQREVLGEASK